MRVLFGSIVLLLAMIGDVSAADIGSPVPIPGVKPTPAKPTPISDAARYAGLVKDVEEGRANVMIVGPHPSLHEYIHQERFPSGFMGMTDGVYDCFKQDGQAVMQKREEVKPAARPFLPSPTTPLAAGVVAPPPATAARPFVSLGAGPGALRIAPYSGSGCTTFR